MSSSSGLVGSARILWADNGAEVTCEELHRTGERPLAWPPDERNRVVARAFDGLQAPMAQR
jgi:hypothetical protein